MPAGTHLPLKVAFINENENENEIEFSANLANRENKSASVMIDKKKPTDGFQVQQFSYNYRRTCTHLKGKNKARSYFAFSH